MTTPYYEDDAVTLYHGGDCRKVTAWLEADVLVTDPPYGINGSLSASYKGKKRASGFVPVHDRAVTWDATLEARDAAIAAWGDRPAAVFASPKRMDAPPFVPREVPLIWDKGQLVGMGDLTFPWRVNYELIYVRGDFTGRRTSTTVLRYDLSNRAAALEGHPTPKPVGLMAELITKAPPGVIADPFTGSGSTLVAAKLHGRRAIGVEIDERYCEITARRLGQDVLTFDGGVA